MLLTLREDRAVAGVLGEELGAACSAVPVLVRAQDLREAGPRAEVAPRPGDGEHADVVGALEDGLVHWERGGLSEVGGDVTCVRAALYRLKDLRRVRSERLQDDLGSPHEHP